MAIKSFLVDYKGSKETVEYETELSFGETEGIINQSLDLTDIQHPKVKIGNFRMQILLKTLRKAPFSYANEIVLKSIPNNTINSILDHIMQDYPLVNFLGDWMTSFMGSEEVKEQLSDSTPTVQSNSDGQKKKQTNTVPSSSKK
jgi:hypothetical protein|tara:strand:+ start:2527 stop:2958 length:432 start_codon:yes stop_codon:yes gene_type:complete